MSQTQQTRRQQDTTQQRGLDNEQTTQPDRMPAGNQFAADRLAEHQAREQGGPGSAGGGPGGPQGAQVGGDATQANAGQDETGTDQEVAGGEPPMEDWLRAPPSRRAARLRVELTLEWRKRRRRRRRRRQV